MKNYTITCGICKKIVLQGVGEVIGKPRMAALCEQCEPDQNILLMKTPEAQAIDIKFQDIINSL